MEWAPAHHELDVGLGSFRSSRALLLAGLTQYPHP